MSDRPSQFPVARRSFFSRLGAGLTAFGAGLVTAQTTGAAQSTEGHLWQPSRHAQDDWLDQMPGKHRLVFDTTNPLGLGNVMLFANNYFLANQAGYGVSKADIAVVIVVRHGSTAFAFNDAIWSKYGAPMAKRVSFEDPKTKQPPTVNLYNSAAHAGLLPNRNNTLDGLAKLGVQLAVCQMATRANAVAIAEATGGKAESIFDELAANLVANSRLVPAGIVTVNRAQERGYSLAYAG